MLSWAILSPVIIVVWAVVLIGLERVFPYRPQKLLRTGFFTDLLGYGLVQSYVLGWLIALLIGGVDRYTGWSKLGLVSGWPVLGQLCFFFVVHDFYIYWFHRLQHYSDTLWRIHEAHHSVDDVDWLSGTRSHALEIMVNQTVEFLPIALLGAAPEVVLMKATLDAVWGMYIHSNLNVRAGLLQRVLNGPEMHRWHHATELPIPGKNFATKLAIWDFLFGTAYLPEHKPARYGLSEPEYPRTGFWAYLKQHAHSLRRTKEAIDG
jgi:sterol desaturase/sphingolipid hydroxylase (fatty acid hydroxylase superfamily)